MKYVIPLFMLLLLFTTHLFGQESDTTQCCNKLVTLNSSFSYKMLEPNQDLRKVRILLEERQKGTIKDQNLVVGASLISLMDYQVSNTDSKFGYLMRHPTASNQIGTEVSEAVIHSFQLGLTGSINNWIAAWAEFLYNPQQSFGQGTITALGRNLFQLRKGGIVLGDLNEFPIYGAIGKMDTPFGLTGSVNAFTNSTMWHAFGGLGFGAQVGFKHKNLHFTFMAVQGGAQFRGLNTPVGDTTSIPSRLNNFVLDLNYTLPLGSGAHLMTGASYLHGSNYCQSFPVVHFGGCVERNPARTVYGQLVIEDVLMINAAFAKTAKVWPGTHNPIPPLDVFQASKVSSLSLGGKYFFPQTGSWQVALSGEFSNFRAGEEGAPWERQNQIVLGLSGTFKQSSKLFLELFRVEGYVPLNFLSGGNMAPGETHSVHGAMTHGVVLGGQISI